MVSEPAAPSVVTLRPLYVDLDGTLVKSDTLVDSLLVMLRTRPALLMKLPGRLIDGKAAFKAFVTNSISLDVARLPYNRKLLQFLQQERGRGREIYLATGADEQLGRRVAAHLGFFSGVLGSNGATNLTGNNKLDRIGSGEFDYIGNASADLPLLAHATEPMMANPSLALRLRLRARGIHPKREFAERSHPLKSLLHAVRLHQWAKNLLIFVPLLLSHAVSSARLLTGLLAFICFSLTASATYIVNDLLDIEADRRHPPEAPAALCLGRSASICGPLYCRCLSAACAFLRTVAAARLLWVAAALSGLHTCLLFLFEAHCAGGCAGALRDVHVASSGRRRFDPYAYLALACRLFYLPVSVPGLRQALRGTGKPAHKRFASGPMAAVTWWPIVLSCAHLERPAPLRRWLCLPTTSAGVT